jgi:amino acid transporter
MIATALVTAATVAIGASGYVAEFVGWPRGFTVSLIIVVLAAVAAWGVLESVLLASLFTLIEVGGLVLIVGAGLWAGVPVGDALFTVPPLDFGTLSGIGFASLLAFFAFIGFEDLTNMVEETVEPHRVMPRALAITLVATVLLYVLVAAVAVTAVSPAELAQSDAPLSLVFRRLANVSPATLSAIAIVATLNTILAEMTMATRVVYGLANLGDLPRAFGKVHHRTATPLIATAVIAVLTLGLALVVPFLSLAETASVGTLVVFALVNLSLIVIRRRHPATTAKHLRVPLWIPVAGLLTSSALILAGLL